MDDESYIRDLFAAYLQRRGFRVLTAAGGASAIELYRQCPGEVALVLLDIRMPGMSGPETLAALRQIDPTARWCFMSGDLGGHNADELMQQGALELFVKPIAMENLVESLRRLTGSPSGPSA